METDHPTVALPLSGSIAIIVAILFPAIVVLVAGTMRSVVGALFVVAAFWLAYAHRGVLTSVWRLPSSRKTFVIAMAVSTIIISAVVLSSGGGDAPMRIQDYLLVAWVFVLPLLTRRIRASLARPA